MWYLKFKVKHSDCIFAPLAEKYGVSIEFYPLSYYRQGGYVYTAAIHNAKGEEKAVRNYLRDLKKVKRVVKMEVSKVVFTLTKEKISLGAHYEAIYNPMLFYVTPGHNSSDGFEVWEMASWDRKQLENLIQLIEKAKTTEGFEVLKFEEKNLDDIYILQLFPQLPKKQKEAIEIAYKEGYYRFPRKTNLDKLAKIRKVSKQTFQENLKKAENRLMPLLLRE
jgi:predicted DNA binding protein